MLSGWYVDIVVGFLIRSLIRRVKTRRSAAWHLEKGRVYSSNCPSISYGGPVAEVGYTYNYRGEYYSGIHREPFLLRSSAEDYASRFVVGSDLTVRVDPERPDISFVSRDDVSLGTQAPNAMVL